MGKKIFRPELSTGKDSIIDRIFDSRAEELAKEKGGVITNDGTERFLDVVSNVKDETLQNQLRTIYLKEDDNAGEVCARLTKKYYENGFVDGAKLIIECVNGGTGK